MRTSIELPTRGRLEAVSRAEAMRVDAQVRRGGIGHLSKGCSQENLRATGGDGLFDCFAAK